MNDDKRPLDASAPTNAYESPQEAETEGEEDFFTDEEHDGWGEIQIRRPSDPG